MNRPFFRAVRSLGASSSIAAPSSGRRPHSRSARHRHRPRARARRRRVSSGVSLVSRFGRDRSIARRSGAVLGGLVRDSLRPRRRAPARRARRAFGLPALPGHLGVLVLVLGVARRAARLLHVVADHRDDGVVGHAAARADSNRPECHQAEAGAAASTSSRRILAGGGSDCERRGNISRAGFWSGNSAL